MRSRAITRATWDRLRAFNRLPQGSKKNIALTGFMAVGKSVVGRRLAQRLRRRFVDLDQAIEAGEAMSVSEIFDRKGEKYFRAKEKRLLRDILKQDGQVVATGGGAILDSENLRLLKQKALLVCLRAAPQALLERLGGAKDRPLLRGDGKQKRIEELLEARGKSYAEAHVCIDTDGLTVDEVVEKIIEAVGLRRAQSSRNRR